MIGRIQGILIEASQETVIVDVQGIGYEVHPHGRAFADLQSQLGQSVLLWIYTHVREDALQLFGFLSFEEKNLFLQLLKVNGVGPKSALNALSGASASEVTNWIESGDAKALSKIPKVGKKTAEQIILTLQGKLVRVEAAPKQQQQSQTLKEIQFALTNLGFKTNVVEEFLATLPEEIEVEEGIRLGLSQLAQARGEKR
jgi:holliday junction DNA helicase RuvA